MLSCQELVLMMSDAVVFSVSVWQDNHDSSPPARNELISVMRAIINCSQLTACHH